MRRHYLVLVALPIFAATSSSAVISGQTSAPEQLIKVDLTYAAPGNGPAPNFSPKGTQVALKDVGPSDPLPPGAARPAKRGLIEVGPGKTSWIPVLATATAANPKDLTQLFIDRNRNGTFDDDGPAMTATPSQNDKTKAWWTSINKVELSVPYAAGVSEPFLVNFWIVREDGAAPPDILRFSRGSWRTGKTTINGVPALVAAMDSDNNAIFDKADYWTVLEASATDAPKAVLSIAEARQATRFMFVPKDGKDLVLEFRSFSPDGRSLSFAVVDKPMTKAADRAPDDMIREERERKRAETKFSWGHDYNAALAKAAASGKKLFIDFETTWCGPCKTMDEWIWTDAEVAAALNAGFIGVKLDGDIEKALTKQHKVSGYPTMVVLDAKGVEITRAVGYQSSKEMLVLLKK
jgi:thiol-disulfide isomerase/thioredoxin